MMKVLSAYGSPLMRTFLLLAQAYLIWKVIVQFSKQGLDLQLNAQLFLDALELSKRDGYESVHRAAKSTSTISHGNVTLRKINALSPGALPSAKCSLTLNDKRG